MENLKYYQNIIKEKRKQTSFRDFLMEIVSFRSLYFYKNQGFISIFPETDRIRGLVSHKQFAENLDTVMDQGKEYDFGMSFFENFKSLYKSFEYSPTILYGDSHGSEYSDQTLESNNAYLSYVVIKDCENVGYSFSVKENSSNVFNSLMVWNNCSNIYSSHSILESSNIFYSRYVLNSSDIWFSLNMIGCHHCIDCKDLENKSYCIDNKQYNKQEYIKQRNILLQNKSSFLSSYKKIYTGGSVNIASKNIQGSGNIECHNIQDGHLNFQVDGGRNILLIGGKGLGENVYDSFINTPPEHDIYGTFSIGYSDNLYSCYHIEGCSNIYYSFYMIASDHCIGCIGLRNKSYCIFNKQYSKEDWEILADKIFSQMESDGVLGNFFPGELNPFYFNDTMASILGNFTKQEVEEKGYLWRDEEVKVDIPEGSEVIQTTDLDNYQGYDENGDWKIDRNILKTVIIDEKENYYRIVQMEYDFLVKHGLPLPEIHWMDRIKLNFGV